MAKVLVTMVLGVPKLHTAFDHGVNDNKNRFHLLRVQAGLTERPSMCAVLRLRPPSNCNGLETITCSFKTLGKQSLQHLDGQHNLNVNPEHGIDTVKAVVVNHIMSGIALISCVIIMATSMHCVLKSPSLLPNAPS